LSVHFTGAQGYANDESSSTFHHIHQVHHDHGHFTSTRHVHESSLWSLQIDEGIVMKVMMSNKTGWHTLCKKMVLRSQPYTLPSLFWLPIFVTRLTYLSIEYTYLFGCRTRTDYKALLEQVSPRPARLPTSRPPSLRTSPGRYLSLALCCCRACCACLSCGKS
jgi:hypothetical protein